MSERRIGTKVPGLNIDIVNKKNERQRLIHEMLEKPAITCEVTNNIHRSNSRGTLHIKTSKAQNATCKAANVQLHRENMLDGPHNISGTQTQKHRGRHHAGQGPNFLREHSNKQEELQSIMFGSQGNNRRGFKESLESNLVVHSEGNRSDNQVTLIDGATNVQLSNQNGLISKLTKMRKKIIQMDEE